MPDRLPPPIELACAAQTDATSILVALERSGQVVAEPEVTASWSYLDTFDGRLTGHVDSIAAGTGSRFSSLSSRR